ncbi:MAG: formyltransferase family protein [Chloroflexota bacterium]
MLTLGWFSTGRDKAARDLLAIVMDAIQRGELDARIQLVFSNREPGEAHDSDLFFQQVHGYGIPLVTLSSQRFRRERGGGPLQAHRLEYHREVRALLDDYRPDLYVLAGYMLIVDAEMCRRYAMINLHPAAPGGPAGTWQEVIWKLIEEDARQTGVKMHLVTEELDLGATATYCTFPIRGESFDPLWKEAQGRSVAQLQATYGEEMPLFRLIRQHGVARELPLILATLKALAEGRVAIKEGAVVDAQGRPVEGHCLTEEMDREVARLGLPSAW